MNADTGGVFASGEFAARLVAVNHLSALGFDRFLFLPGMGFGAMEKWWPSAGPRTFSHEGIDLLLFRTFDNALFRFDETIRVPLIHPGKIVGLIPDFLGRTIIASHRIPGSGLEDEFYTFYGHVTPDLNLTVGDTLNAGDIIARIAPVDFVRTRLPAHLHLSAAWCCRLPPAETLNWYLLNRTDRSVFIDPMNLLAVSYDMISPAAAGPLHQIPQCGSA